MIQYNLWSDCKNNCEFCFNKDRTKNVNKIENIKKIIELINLDEVKKYSKVSIIGGELFDSKFDEELKKYFYNLADTIIKKENFKELYIMTNLLYNIDLELNDFLKYINNRIKIVICTSYDLKGRFHTENHLKLFNKNFAYLKNKYTMHIEIILTDIFMKSFIDGSFNYKNFVKQYTNNIDFIAPHCGCYGKNTNNFLENKYFFSNRETFFKFLDLFFKTTDYDIDRFLKRDNHSDICYYLVNDKLVRYGDRINTVGSMPQDHNVNYINDNKHSMYEDFQNFKKFF